MENFDNLMLHGVVGSHAYGYATAESDVDFMSVKADPLSKYFGLGRGSIAKQNVSDAEDITVYEFRHFMRLCANFNPNVIPLLFLDGDRPMNSPYLGAWRFVHPVMVNVLKNRDAFISLKNARMTLAGYAKNMMERSKLNVTGKWGAKRKDLVEKYGYDVKAAAHAIRLLRMGVHLCDSGQVLNDVAWALCAKIRGGEYDMEYVFEELFPRHFEMFDSAYEANLGNVRIEPDLDRIDEICVKAMVEYHFDWKAKGR